MSRQQQHRPSGSSSAVVLDMLHSRKPSSPTKADWSTSGDWIPLNKAPTSHGFRSSTPPSAESSFRWQDPEPKHLRKKYLVRGALGVLACCVGIWVLTRHSTSSASSRSLTSPSSLWRSAFASSSDLTCNPYDQSGFLNWTADDPRTAQWVTYPASKTDLCPSPPDYFARIAEAFTDSDKASKPGSPEYNAKQTAQADIEFMKGKTVLLMGDSVDRNALFQMADLMHAGVWPSNYLNSSETTVPEGWDARGVPHVLDQWQLGFRVYNNFFYGMDDEDDFSKQNDWRAPGKFEQRLEELFKPFMKDLKRPDLISLHTGMWDLALFGRQDTRRQVNTATPIDEHRVKWWFKRMDSAIKALQEAFPGVPILIRIIHRVGELPSLSSGDYTKGVQDDPTKVQNFFTDLRIRQFQEMQKSVARQHCLPYWDFSKTWEGYQHLQDKVHPEPLPGGLAYGYPLLHALKMETIGRERWLNKPCEGQYQL